MTTSSISIKSSLAFGGALCLATMTSFAATTFVPVPGFDADVRGGSAEWDLFTAPSGSQGAAPVSVGLNAPTSTDLNINVLVAIPSPGGIIGGGDSYYSHSGAYSFDAVASFSVGVDFARVSYALVGSQGSPDPFPIAPDIAAATSLSSGSYSDGTNTIFYADFDLGSTTTDITATFGDAPAPFSSFRSINGVRIEGLSAAPIPEPSSAALLLLGLGFIARRRR